MVMCAFYITKERVGFSAKLHIKNEGIRCYLQYFCFLHHCLMKRHGFLLGLRFWELLFNHVCQSGIT